jgi:hypothetical protein
MKNLLTLLVIALFTINISAQQTKPAAKAPVKKEACCAKNDTKKCTAEEKAKCTADEKAKSEKTSKSCCAKK